MWSLGLGLGMEASPGNFFSSKLSRELTGSFWKKKKKEKSTEAQKALGNLGKTMVFEIIRVKFDFWLKDLAEIPYRILHKINKVMTIRVYLDCEAPLVLVKNEKL